MSPAGWLPLDLNGESPVQRTASPQSSLKASRSTRRAVRFRRGALLLDPLQPDQLVTVENATQSAGSACVGSRRRVRVGRRYGPLPLHPSDVPPAVGIPMTSSHSTNRQPGRDHRRRPNAPASLDREGVLAAASETGLCPARTTQDGRLRIWMIGASEPTSSDCTPDRLGRSAPHIYSGRQQCPTV